MDSENKKQPTGSTDAADLVKHYARQIKEGKSWFEQADIKINRQFVIQKWCFFFGVVSLVVSYASPIICELFEKAPAIKAALINLQ